NDAQVQLPHLGRRGPLQQRDQRHPLFETGAGFFLRRDDLLGEINDERNTGPPPPVVGQAQEEAAQQRREPDELARWAGLVEVRVLDLVVNLQPLEEPLLRVGRAKGQAVADVVEQQKIALGKQASGEKRFERDVFNLLRVLHRKGVKDVSVQDKDGVRGAV